MQKQWLRVVPPAGFPGHTLYREWAQKLGISYNFSVKHYSEVLGDKIDSGKLTLNEIKTKVTWHDSCYIGRAGGLYEPRRKLIKPVPGVELVEMEHNGEDALCCGSVLSLISEPEIAYGIGKKRLDEVKATCADEVLSLCPCCQFQLRVSASKNNMPVKVTDLSSFLAKARGYEVKEDLDHVMNSWATFEAMINLMIPENMAEMMEEIFPQMVDAMPLVMGKMMRFIGKLGPPGGFILGAMKPLFPLLFPLLMPGMMAKVMPAMLKAVEKRVLMPDFMKEQMPELMPAAMENLMPNMLPDIVPLVSQPLIDYLRGRRSSSEDSGKLETMQRKVK